MLVSISIVVLFVCCKKERKIIVKRHCSITLYIVHCTLYIIVKRHFSITLYILGTTPAAVAFVLFNDRNLDNHIGYQVEFCLHISTFVRFLRFRHKKPWNCTFLCISETLGILCCWYFLLEGSVL